MKIYTEFSQSPASATVPPTRIQYCYSTEHTFSLVIYKAHAKLKLEQALHSLTWKFLCNFVGNAPIAPICNRKPDVPFS